MAGGQQLALGVPDLGRLVEKSVAQRLRVGLAQHVGTALGGQLGAVGVKVHRERHRAGGHDAGAAQPNAREEDIAQRRQAGKVQRPGRFVAHPQLALRGVQAVVPHAGQVAADGPPVVALQPGHGAAHVHAGAIGGGRYGGGRHGIGAEGGPAHGGDHGGGGGDFLLPAGIGLAQLHHPMLGGAVGAHGAGHQVHGTVLHRAGKVHGQRQRLAQAIGVLQHAVQQQGGRGTAVRADHVGVARMGVGDKAAVRLGLKLQHGIQGVWLGHCNS